MLDYATFRPADIHITVDHDAGEASVSQEFVLDNPAPPPPGECSCCCFGQPTGFTLTVAPLEIPGPGGRCDVTMSDDE